MADDALFRKAALDKLASPERLDVLMQVTPPQGPIALWTIGGLLMGAAAWGFFGSMPERIPGQGLLMGEGGIQYIKAGGDGILTRLELTDNQMVSVDQVLGAISGVGLEEAARAAQARYDQASREYDAMRSSEEASISDLRAERGRTALRLKDRQAFLAEREEMVKKELISARSIDPLRREVDSLQSELTGVDDRIRSRQQNIQRAAGRVEQARIELQRHTNTTADVAQVKSTVAGRVIAISKRRGDSVRTGDTIAEVETVTGEIPVLEIVAFVSAQVGKAISPGDPTQLTVAGVKREEYGFMKGAVKTVSEFPVGSERVAEIMKEDATKEASYEVRIAVEPDPATVSGFAWSNGAGPPLRVTSGTPVTVDIEVDQRRPISMLMPYIRKTFGG